MERRREGPGPLPVRGTWVALGALLIVSISPALARADIVTFTGTVSASETAWRAHFFSVGSPGQISATLDWDDPAADLNLFLYDPSGSLVATATSTTAKPEGITYEATVVGRWKVGVKAVSGSASYTLQVGFPSAPTLTATDRAAEAGIAQITRSWGTYVVDVDLDGDQDFLYNRHWGYEMILYANDGAGHFTQRAAGTFRVKDPHGCSWGDVDRNGYPDLYCTVGAGKGWDVKANVLWLQGSDGTFTRAPGAWGADDPYGRGRDAALFDVNGDRLLDLFVGNFYRRPDGIPTPNRLYIQRPPGTFRSAPEYGVDVSIGGLCAEPADLDLDDDLDLAVCGFGPRGSLTLYRNEKGNAFTDVAPSLGVTGRWCDALWVDLDLDGRVDLTRMDRTSFEVMMQRPDGTFVTTYRMSMGDGGCRFDGGSRIAAGDVNLDGYPDLYVLSSGYTSGAYNLPDVFLVNEGTGRSFSSASLPQTTLGSGFSVAAIQADRDARMEFLLTNGRADLKGPIQLIDFGS